jgi:mannonate dehydratase
MRPYRFQQSFRWFGPNDLVSLADIRMAGCSHVVTALHEIPNGEVWPTEKIEERKRKIEKASLKWKVVESIPVHEDIKKRSGDFEKYIEAYKTSMINLAKVGIKVITYNFMPVLDWTRTQLAFDLPTGAKALRFDVIDYVLFDAFILRRADANHSPELLEEAKSRCESLSATAKEELTQSVLAGLPGSEESYTIEAFREILSAYSGIDSEKLRQNLILFLEEIVPMAESHGLLLALHPDDPPFPLFGLPRVVSRQADYQKLFDAVPNPANGICFCTGSLGAIPENDISAMIDAFSDRIHFAHLRNVQRESNGSFYEADHLDGSTDMVDVIARLSDIMQKRRVNLPMRPDHGHSMLDDQSKKTNPGYSAIGRLKGLAEIRGVERGILVNSKIQVASGK